MKTVKSMNVSEVKATQERYTSKHPVLDNMDMTGKQLVQYKQNLIQAVQTGDTETLTQTIADIFYYGFMNGAKQTDKEIKAKAESHYFNESQRKLTELAYYLPLGCGAEHFYTLVVLLLNSNYNGIETMLPTKQRKAFIECVEEAEQRKKAKESEVQTA